VSECPKSVQIWIERYREAYAAANGEEKAARLSASYNHGWIKLELAPEDTSYWTGPEWYKNVRLRELAQMTQNLQQQVAYARSQAVTSSKLEAMRPGDDCPKCGDPIMDVENDDEEPRVVGKCCATCDWYEESGAAPGPLEVTIVGNGDPEVFAAHEVEILVSGRTYMIEPGEWGGLLIRTPGVVLPYHLGATCVGRSAIRVGVYVTAADEAKARAAQEKTGD